MFALYIADEAVSLCALLLFICTVEYFLAAAHVDTSALNLLIVFCIPACRAAAHLFMSGNFVFVDAVLRWEAELFWNLFFQCQQRKMEILPIRNRSAGSLCASSIVFYYPECFGFRATAGHTSTCCNNCSWLGFPAGCPLCVCGCV